MGLLGKLAVRLCFDKDGRPTWFGIVCFFLGTILAVAVCSLFGGCMNCYYRAPWTNGEISECYQPTKTAAVAVPVIAFPQMMSDNPHDYAFSPANILTVPLALVALCTVPVEAALDTVCLPVDLPLADSRKKKGK